MTTTKQKVALITGAAQRIGAQLTRTLHQTGYNVVIHYGQSSEAAITLEAELNNSRPNSAISCQADLTKLADVKNLAEKTLASWGHIDVLINNASRFYPTQISTVTEDSWNDLFDSNLRAPFFLCQALAESLSAQKGCIINIVDIYSERPLKDYPVYSMTKAGIAMLTKTLAMELGPAVRVNGISPGAILWPQSAAELSLDAKQRILKRTALKTTGNPKDICNAALFLIEQSPYVTGQIIAVDGGRTLQQ